MRLVILSSFLIWVLGSCTFTTQKKKSGLNQLENAPFEQLKTVRVMLSFISDKVDRQTIRQIIIDKFQAIGVVHTPDNTSLEQVVEAQKNSFALLVFEIKEIKTSDYERAFPIISLSCKMYEVAELALNKKESMSNVWEKIHYIEILSDQKATTDAVNVDIDKILKEFSDNYYAVNSKSLKPTFYIGKNIE